MTSHLPRFLVRDAVLAILRKSPEPASVKELALAAYYFTGDDRVSSASVQSALQRLAKDDLVERCGRGVWRALPCLSVGARPGRRPA